MQKRRLPYEDEALRGIQAPATLALCVLGCCLLYRERGQPHNTAILLRRSAKEAGHPATPNPFLRGGEGGGPVPSLHVALDVICLSSAEKTEYPQAQGLGGRLRRVPHDNCGAESVSRSCTDMVHANIMTIAAGQVTRSLPPSAMPSCAIEQLLEHGFHLLVEPRIDSLVVLGRPHPGRRVVLIGRGLPPPLSGFASP